MGHPLTEGNPLAGGSVGGSLSVDGRFHFSKGADVASANDTTLGTDGNIFDITGVTTINGIRVLNWETGSWVILQFDSALTVKHNTAPSAGFAKIQLLGGADLTTFTGLHLALYYDGTNWMETALPAHIP